MKSTPFWRLVLVILAIVAARLPAAQATQEEDIRKLFGKRDANGDKRLSEDEFAGDKAGKARAKLRKQFRGLDQDGDAWLSLHEFKRGSHE